MQKLCTKLKEFSHEKEMMKLRGFNDFNYFELLAGKSKENAHSKIIAEFLDSKGSHYQGKLFLENLLKQINKEELLKKEWNVYTEYSIENSPEQASGRIDIYLESKDMSIIVENKIYAGEQKAQIYKYVENIGKNQDNILVIYLSFYGKKPSQYSLNKYKINGNAIVDEKGVKKADFLLITYEDILKWMNMNLEVIENISNLRESIKQYITTVEKLLSKEKNMMNLKDFLLKEEQKEDL